MECTFRNSFLCRLYIEKRNKNIIIIKNSVQKYYLVRVTNIYARYDFSGFLTGVSMENSVYIVCTVVTS